MYEPVTIEAADVPTPSAQARREDLIRGLLLLNDGESPGAPEDRLATTLLELTHATASLRTVAPTLPSTLSAPAVELARRIDTALRSTFREVIE